MKQKLYSNTPNEIEVTDTAWTQVLIKQGMFVPYQHFVHYSCEITTDTLDEVVGVQILYNGNEVSMDIKNTLIANQYMKFTDFGMFVGPDMSGLVTIQVNVRTLNPGITAKIRKQRLMVMIE